MAHAKLYCYVTADRGLVFLLSYVKMKANDAETSSRFYLYFVNYEIIVNKFRWVKTFRKYRTYRLRITCLTLLRLSDSIGSYFVLFVRYCCARKPATLPIKVACEQHIFFFYLSKTSYTSLGAGC